MTQVVGKPGFRIQYEIQRPSPAVVDELAKYSSCNIADAQGRFRVMDPGIKPIHPQVKAAGPAVTVLVRPGDNLMVHKALEVAQPGDIIVVNTCGCANSAVFGELMANTLLGARLGGIVVDGGIRDLPELQEMGVAVFTRSIIASGCDKDGPGEINFPIACGGVAVLPGDIIIGDTDGVVVVPKEDAEYVLDRVRQIEATEAKRIEEIKQGHLFKAEIDNTLRAKGIIA